VSDFPGELRSAWLADLLDLNTEGVVDVVQRVDPVDEDRLSWLRRKWQVARAEEAVTGRPGRAQAMHRISDHIQELLAAQTSGEPLLNYAVYIVVSGRDWSSVDGTVEQVQRRLQQYPVATRVPWFRMNRAARVVTGLVPDTIGGRVVSGQGVAAGFPWAARDTVDDNGVLYGRESRSDTPVILDRYSWEAGHIARMGKIGSGKSFAAKLEIHRCLHRYDDLQVVIVDPKQEYAAFEDRDGVDRLTVDDRTEENIGELVDHVWNAYHQGHLHEGKSLVVVDEAHRLLRDENGRDALGTLIREGRDQSIAVTVVTQNAADFTVSREGRNMLKNIDLSVLMRHQDVSTDVEEFFNLSRTEAAELRKLRSGTDVDFSEAVVQGVVNSRLRVRAGPGEAAAIGEPAAAPEESDHEDGASLVPLDDDDIDDEDDTSGDGGEAAAVVDDESKPFTLLQIVAFAASFFGGPVGLGMAGSGKSVAGGVAVMCVAILIFHYVVLDDDFRGEEESGWLAVYPPWPAVGGTVVIGSFFGAVMGHSPVLVLTGLVLGVIVMVVGLVIDQQRYLKNRRVEDEGGEEV